METRRIARVLEEMGTLLEIQGENPFRCRAYHNAAQALRGLPADLSQRVADRSLASVPGIGEAMFQKIARLATTDELPEYEELRRQTPLGLFGLLRVPGLGPRKIKILHETLGIQSLPELRAAAESGRVAGLKGFGEKTQQRILEGIAFVESVGNRILLSTAQRLATPILQDLRVHPGVTRAEICGSVRRRRETIGDIDILFSSANPGAVLADLVTRPEVASVLEQGPTSATLRLVEGVPCDLRGVQESQFAIALHEFTGSEAHRLAMRRRARERGWTLSASALEGPDGPIPCATEEALFAALGLDFIPPELREDRGELEAAAAGPLPRLVERSDLTGCFHCHTDWSDGGDTLEDMAEAARAAGFTYLGIADHSRSAGYAGGLTPDRVRAQWHAIDRLNERYGPGFRLLKGTECDILPDGTLDYPDDLLAGFDYVVASVHSSFNLPREAMTRRILRAVEHPLVTMLGHPTGRLLLSREGYALDLDAVIAAAAVAGTMIEINANPHRLDLDDVYARHARDAGVRIAINPDAHATRGLNDLEYGIGQARRAGLTPADVFNTRPLPAILDELRRRRSRC